MFYLYTVNGNVLVEPCDTYERATIRKRRLTACGLPCVIRLRQTKGVARRVASNEGPKPS